MSPNIVSSLRRDPDHSDALDGVAASVIDGVAGGAETRRVSDGIEVNREPALSFAGRTSTFSFGIAIGSEGGAGDTGRAFGLRRLNDSREIGLSDSTPSSWRYATCSLTSATRSFSSWLIKFALATEGSVKFIGKTWHVIKSQFKALSSPEVVSSLSALRPKRR